MHLFGLALAATVLAASVAVAAEPMPSAEDVMSRLTGELTDEQREAWFDSSAKGKAVTWVAPVFNVTTSFGLVFVNGRVSDRGLFACEVPKRLEANAKRAKAGEVVLCAGRVEGYERYSGAAIVNVIADDFVVGQRNIDAWEKAQKQKASKQ
jgi:hypothetical protein